MWIEEREEYWRRIKRYIRRGRMRERWERIGLGEGSQAEGE